MRWPVDHPVIRGPDRARKERNTFGMVRRNADGTPRPHQGIDLSAPIGTACLAVADGVIAAVSSGGDYGHTLTLRFPRPPRREGASTYDWLQLPEELFAFYAHLSEVLVRVGDRVADGDVIARAGESGNAMGMPFEDQHLHFEIRTKLHAGRGLADRVSPALLFGPYPWGL